METSSKQEPRDSLHLSWELRQGSVAIAGPVMGSAKILALGSAGLLLGSCEVKVNVTLKQTKDTGKLPESSLKGSPK